MSKLVTAVGVLFVFMGLWILIAPEHLMSVADWDSRTGQNVAGGVRLVMGLFLMVAAPATRYPKGIRIFGGVVILAGLVVLAVSAEAWSTVMELWMGTNLVLMRVSGGIGGVLIGAFFIHAARPDEISTSSQ